MAISRTRQVSGCTHGPGCPHDIGPTQDLVIYPVDTTVTRRPATPAELARLEAAEPTYLKRQPASRSAQRAIPAATTTERHSEDTGPKPVASRNPAARTEASAAIPATVEEDPVTTPASPPALPCGTCLHEPVCGLKASLGEEPWNAEPVSFAPGLRAIRSVIRVECDHQLPRARGGPMPAPGPSDAERTAVSRRRGTERSLQVRKVASIEDLNARVAAASKRYPLPRDRAERDRVVLEAVRSTSRVAEAGIKLGVSEARIRQVVGEIREAGGLPEDVDQLLEARRRHQVPA